MTRSRSIVRPGSHYRFRDASVDALGPGWVSLSLGPDASRPVLWYREALRAVVVLGENRILTDALASLGFALVYRGLDHRVYLGPALAAAEPSESPGPPAADPDYVPDVGPSCDTTQRPPTDLVRSA